MLTTKPRVRIVGRGRRLRVRTKGDWDSDVPTALREACRASVAVDKALAEAVQHARTDDMSWGEIGRVLGVADDATDMDALVTALGQRRGGLLRHQLRAKPL
jgi:hypothetical protein